MGRTYRRERLDDQVDTGIKRTAVNDRIGRTIDAIVAADANDMPIAIGELKNGDGFGLPEDRAIG
jgi:hypothetical protein